MSANRRVNPNTESVDNYLKAIFTLGGLDEKRVPVRPWPAIWASLLHR